MTLWVRVLQARNLKAMDRNGSSDPYVRLTLGKQKFRTNVVKKDLNPIWAEEFSFQIDDVNDKLNIVVMDEDKGLNNDTMGKLKISVAKVFGRDDKSLGTAWYTLESKSKKSNSGEILLTILISQSYPFLDDVQSYDGVYAPYMDSSSDSSSVSLEILLNSSSVGPLREDFVVVPKHKSSAPSVTARIAQVFTKKGEAPQTRKKGPSLPTIPGSPISFQGTPKSPTREMYDGNAGRGPTRLGLPPIRKPVKTETYDGYVGVSETSVALPVSPRIPKAANFDGYAGTPEPLVARPVTPRSPKTPKSEIDDRYVGISETPVARPVTPRTPRTPNNEIYDDDEDMPNTPPPLPLTPKTPRLEIYDANAYNSPFEDQSSNCNFDEGLKIIGSNSKEAKMPSNLRGGVLLDQYYMLESRYLNFLLFSPDSSFMRSLAEIKGNTEWTPESWRLGSDGKILRRVVTYMRAATKLTKTVKATEKQYYLKADGYAFAVHVSVSTPDVMYGTSLRTEILYCIIPGPDLPEKEHSSRLIVSWRMNFLENLTMKDMIESGAGKALKNSFEQFANFIAQNVKPVDLLAIFVRSTEDGPLILSRENEERSKISVRAAEMNSYKYSEPLILSTESEEKSKISKIEHELKSSDYDEPFILRRENEDTSKISKKENELKSSDYDGPLILSRKNEEKSKITTRPREVKSSGSDEPVILSRTIEDNSKISVIENELRSSDYDEPSILGRKNEDRPKTPMRATELKYATYSFNEAMKRMESSDQGAEVPASLSGGVLLDKSYLAAPHDLNSLLFGPDSKFTRSLADIKGNTEWNQEPWKTEGKSFRRVVTYMKAATKMTKAVKATEEQTYHKADGKIFAVLTTVSTPDVMYGSSFRTEILYCITPGPELLLGEQSSRIIISWRMNFLQSIMMKGMIERGAGKALKSSFEQFESFLSQNVKPVDVKATLLRSNVDTPLISTRVNQDKSLVPMRENEDKPAVLTKTNGDTPSVPVKENEDKPAAWIRTIPTRENEDNPEVSIRTNAEKSLVRVRANEDKPTVLMRTNGEKSVVTMRVNEDKSAPLMRKNEEKSSLSHFDEAVNTMASKDQGGEAPLMRKNEEKSSLSHFDEAVNTMASKDQGGEAPSNLPGGILLDQSCPLASTGLNSLLFSDDSKFMRSLADMKGNTEWQQEPWRLESDGKSLTRVVTYMKAATKITKAVKATEEQTYLKADGKVFAVLARVSTPDIMYGKSFRTEMLYCITPGPEFPKGEKSSRLIVSWRMYFLQNIMMKGMIERGAGKALQSSFEQFANFLSQNVKTLGLKETLIRPNEDKPSGLMRVNEGSSSVQRGPNEDRPSVTMRGNEDVSSVLMQANKHMPLVSIRANRDKFPIPLTGNEKISPVSMTEDEKSTVVMRANEDMSSVSIRGNEDKPLISMRENEYTSPDFNFEKAMKIVALEDQGGEVPTNLPGGILLDQSYMVAPADLNLLLFSPDSNFMRSLAEEKGNTGWRHEPWRLESDGKSLSRVVTYMKAATKLTKAIKATELQTYLRADGEVFAVLVNVSTPEAMYGNSFRTELLYCIKPGRKLPSGEPSSRMTVSWHMHFLQSIMMKDMVERGAGQALNNSFEKFAELLSQKVKIIHSKDFESPQERVSSLKVESQSDWEAMAQHFLNFTVVSTAFMGLYILVHILLATPSTNQWLEFGGIDLPDSIVEVIVCLILGIQGKRAFDMVIRSMQASIERAGDHGVRAQGEGWLLTVALIEGSSLASVDPTSFSDPYVVFTCNGKTKTSSIKFQKLDPQWNACGGVELEPGRLGQDLCGSNTPVLILLSKNGHAEVFEFDAMDEPPSVLDVEVFDFDGPFLEATSLGHVEVNLVKSDTSTLADTWIPLKGKLAQACQSKLRLRIFLTSTKGKDVKKDFLMKMEKEVGKKLSVRSPQTNTAFRKLFGLPAEEFLINDFTCQLKRKMLLQGRIFLSPRIIGFHASLFGCKTTFFFLWEDIEDILVLPATLASLSNPSLIIILRRGRGNDAKNGAETQDEDGRLKFHLHSFVSFSVAHRTIMALWKTRSLSPEQKVQILEEESEDKDLQTEENIFFSSIEDASMSEVISSVLPVPLSFFMELFGGGKLDSKVMEKVGCLDYSHGQWELVKPDVYQRQIHYKFNKQVSRYSGEVISTQQRSPFSDRNGYVFEEVMTLQGVPLGDYFTLHIRFQVEDLSSRSHACYVQVFFGITWLKSTQNQKKLMKNIVSSMVDRLKLMLNHVEKEFLAGNS